MDYEAGDIGQSCVLPNRVVHQPADRLFEGGDCGACVLGGIFGISPGEAYDRFHHGEKDPIRYHEMIVALQEAEGTGLADRVMTAIPIWPVHTVLAAWGFTGAEMGNHWFNYVRMAIESGHYAIALVDIEKRGPNGGGTNHWVLICGARERYGLPGALDQENRIYQEILVSCSANDTPDEEWVDAIDFLEHRGGYNILLVRPT